MNRTGYKKKFLRIWYLLLLSCVLCSLCNGQEEDSVNVTAGATPTEIHVGDRVAFDIVIEWKGEVEIRSVQPAAEMEGFEIVDTPPPTETTVKEELHQKHYRYLLTTFETGETEIPSFKVTYSDAEGKEKTAETLPIKVTVKSLLDPDDETIAIRDIKQPVDVPESHFWRNVIIGVVLALLAIVALLFFIIRKRILAKQASKPSVWEEPRPLHEIAFELLDQLADFALLDQNKIKEYVTRLTEIIKTYLGKRYEVFAIDMTSSELVSVLEGRMKKETREKIDRLLEECDLVKFAKYVPPRSELEALLPVAREIVEITWRPRVVEDIMNEQKEPEIPSDEETTEEAKL